MKLIDIVKRHMYDINHGYSSITINRAFEILRNYAICEDDKHSRYAVIYCYTPNKDDKLLLVAIDVNSFEIAVYNRPHDVIIVKPLLIILSDGERIDIYEYLEIMYREEEDGSIVYTGSYFPLYKLDLEKLKVYRSSEDIFDDKQCLDRYGIICQEGYSPSLYLIDIIKKHAKKLNIA